MDSNLYEVMYRTGTGENPQVEKIQLFTGDVNLVAIFSEGKADRIYIKTGSKKYTHMLERERIVAISDMNYNGEQNDLLIEEVKKAKEVKEKLHLKG